MNDRKQLHALVDSLPERALDSAEKYLQAIQTWPRKEPDRSTTSPYRSSGTNGEWRGLSTAN